MKRLLPLIFLLTACASGPALKTIPAAWMSVPEARKIASISLDAEGSVTPVAPARAAGTIRVEGNRIYNGEKSLTDAFAAIDSFDVSESRGEVAFSAQREGGFDVGLVSTDGSPVSWIPPDPADELAVQWAPRGNKVSFVVRAPGGDVVRTVHIPTSYQVTVPFAQARIHALAWDPPAVKYAVAWSAPDHSDRVEVLRYGGEDRRTAIEPTDSLDVEVEPLMRGALLLRPRDLAYQEKVPLVIWIEDGFGWSDARAALMRRARVALVITTRPLDEALWAAAGALQWIDIGRVYVVGGGREGQAIPAAIRISGDAAVPGGRYRIDGPVVTVAPAVVQSVAAGFIPDHLKRTTRSNGSSR